MTAPSLTALLARVEAAAGPDRELSVRAWFALHPDREGLWALSGLNAQRSLHADETLMEDVLGSPKLYGFFEDEDHYTASLDAALALVERVLPGWWISVETKRSVYVELTEDGGELHTSYGTGSTRSLALLVAMLKALIAKGSA